MRLNTWQERGIDVTSLLGAPMHADRRDVLHSSFECPYFPVQHFDAPDPDPDATITFDSELCDDCWKWNLPARCDKIFSLMEEISVSMEDYKNAMAEGFTGRGFPLLITALTHLPKGHSPVSQWVDRLRAQMIEAFEAEYPDGRHAAQAERLAQFRSQHPETFTGPGTADGLLVISNSSAYGELNCLSASEEELFALYWVPSSPFEGLVAQGPAALLGDLASLMGTRPVPSLADVSYAALEPGDTPAVLEVAGRLYDPASELYSHLDRVLATARSV